MATTDSQKFNEYQLLPDGSGFTIYDGSTYKFDKDGGWYDECNNYYDCNGKPVIQTQPSSRFQEFTLLEDNSGFKLKDGSIFYFDKYDEQKVYYNSNGIKSSPPEESKSFPEEYKTMKDNALFSIKNQLQKNQENQQREKQTKMSAMQRVNRELNEESLNFYKGNNDNSELQFYFKFENVFVKGSEIIEFLTQGIQEIKIKEFSFDYFEIEQKRKKKGTGRFVCKDKFSALNCVKCHNMYLKDSLFQISLKPFQVEKKEKEVFRYSKPKGYDYELNKESIVNKHLFE